MHNLVQAARRGVMVVMALTAVLAVLPGTNATAYAHPTLATTNGFDWNGCPRRVDRCPGSPRVSGWRP
jgi:hypothetical protein